MYPLQPRNQRLHGTKREAHVFKEYSIGIRLLQYAVKCQKKFCPHGLHLQYNCNRAWQNAFRSFAKLEKYPQQEPSHADAAGKLCYGTRTCCFKSQGVVRTSFSSSLESMLMTKSSYLKQANSLCCRNDLLSSSTTNKVISCPPLDLMKPLLAASDLLLWY